MGLTHVGSLARLRKRQTFSMEPFSSKSDLKKRAVSMLTCPRGRGGRSAGAGRLRAGLPPSAGCAQGGWAGPPSPNSPPWPRRRWRSCPRGNPSRPWTSSPGRPAGRSARQSAAGQGQAGSTGPVPVAKSPQRGHNPSLGSGYGPQRSGEGQGVQGAEVEQIGTSTGESIPAWAPAPPAAHPALRVGGSRVSPTPAHRVPSPWHSTHPSPSSAAPDLSGRLFVPSPVPGGPQQHCPAAHCYFQRLARPHSGGRGVVCGSHPTGSGTPHQPGSPLPTQRSGVCFTPSLGRGGNRGTRQWEHPSSCVHQPISLCGWGGVGEHNGHPKRRVWPVMVSRAQWGEEERCRRQAPAFPTPPCCLLHPPPPPPPAAGAVPGAQHPTGTHLIVGETGSGEDGDLLAPGNAVHHVDGRDPSLDHLLGVDAAMGVDGLAWSRKGDEAPAGHPETEESPPLVRTMRHELLELRGKQALEQGSHPAPALGGDGLARRHPCTRAPTQGTPVGTDGPPRGAGVGTAPRGRSGHQGTALPPDAGLPPRPSGIARGQ